MNFTLIDGMKIFMKTLFKMVPAAILIVLLDCLAWLIIGGNFKSFLHPRFLTLLIISAVIIIGFIASFIIGGNPFAHGAIKQNALKSFILFIPVFFMYTVSGQQFGAHALGKKMTGNEQSALSMLKGDAVNTTEKKKKGEETTILKLAMNMKEYNDKRIVTKGVIFKNTETVDGEDVSYTVIFRFAIVCCAADAVPVWVYVDDEALLKFKNESWVEVEGTLKVKNLQGNDVPVIVADKLTDLGEPGPAEKYMYF